MLVLVVEALLRVARRALKTNAAWALAAAAFAALYLFGVPFPVVVLAAALIGYLVPGAFKAGGHGAAKDGPPAVLDAVLAAWRAGADVRTDLAPGAPFVLAFVRSCAEVAERAPVLAAAVPPDARPEPVDGAPPGAVTDPRVFLGLALPVVRVG